MALSNAVPAFGTFLKKGDGATPELYTTIAEVRSMQGPQMSVKIDDVTTHSTGTPWREKLATLLDAGTVSFEINFIPADTTHSYSAGLLKDFTDRKRRTFQLVFPDTPATTWSFSGFVQDFKCSAATDGVLSASISITLTGQPTLA